ncbi:MAG TPA: DNA integrity scanning protein DisA [Firmicutes bacterium]|jgi:diadenylate cyclase|nr:DNA integrity scanning protein DisA [Bacillota bacterium]
MRDEEAMYKYLQMIAPGSQLYEGLENILKAKTGALIVIGDTPEVLALCNGGFRIDAEMHPEALYELAKMDGAIVLSGDTKRILFANTHLTPDPMIPTHETGTRHKTAERVAKQTGQIVISISQRRNVITIYKDNWKHVVREVSVILSKANQALSTLEKYRSVFQQSLANLSALEFEGLVTLSDVTTVLQRSQMVNRIATEIERYVIQLGSEGRLVGMQLDELVADVKDQGLLVFKDYYVGDNLTDAWNQMQEWDADDFLNVGMLSKTLGYSSSVGSLEQPAAARGYRILAKIPRLPMPVIENLVEAFGSLSAIMEATIEELDDVEGIGEVRAKAIRDGLRRLREQALVDSHI